LGNSTNNLNIAPLGTGNAGNAPTLYRAGGNAEPSLYLGDDFGLPNFADNENDEFISAFNSPNTDDNESILPPHQKEGNLNSVCP